VKVFVFVVKEAFDSPCLPQDYKDEIEMSELVKFFNKRFTEFFVFTAKRESFLMYPNFSQGELHKIILFICMRAEGHF